ncbi:11934_t:CDS:2 [Ambispora gerdemannii]|uniref:11934_t:CDS:1 n=1 Tax=Ambispora gerdemannii TaxID=144530 RepID=A0A9N9CQU5_9GLOM|nr:11934_t:CDS:2 [Ambispora gerdemannii]
MALILNNDNHNVPNTPQFTAAIMQKSRPSLLLTAPFSDPSELNSAHTQYHQHEQDTNNNDIIANSLGLSNSSYNHFTSMDFPQSTLHYDLLSTSSLNLIIDDDAKNYSSIEENLASFDPFLPYSPFLSTDSEISTPYYYVPETPSSLATTATTSPYYTLNDTHANDFTFMTTPHETPTSSSINNNTTHTTSSSSVQKRNSKPCPSRNKHRCQWPDCIWSFKRAEHLKRHMLTHTGERKYRCDYPGCNKRFGRSDNFAAHRRIHQRNNPQFVPMSLQRKENNKNITTIESTATIATSIDLVTSNAQSERASYNDCIPQQLQATMYHNSLIENFRQSSAKLDKSPSIASRSESSKKMRSTKRSSERMNPITRRPSKQLKSNSNIPENIGIATPTSPITNANTNKSSSSVDYFTIRPSSSSSQSHSQSWGSEQQPPQKLSSNNYIVSKTNSNHQHFQLCIPGGGIKNYPSPAAETLEILANSDNQQQKL